MFQNLLLKNHVARKAVTCLEVFSAKVDSSLFMVPRATIGEN